MTLLSYHTVKPSRTSDYKCDASDVIRLLGVLHCVHALISLTHRIQDEEAEVAVELGPVVEHVATPHQERIR